AKLMAYKDEYEVARLYADPAFLERLRAAFDGEPGLDYILQFHMAPPRFARHDAQGRPVKRSFGPWLLSAMKVLAPLRRLRGTAPTNAEPNAWTAIGVSATKTPPRARRSHDGRKGVAAQRVRYLRRSASSSNSTSMRPL